MSTPVPSWLLNEPVIVTLVAMNPDAACTAVLINREIVPASYNRPHVPNSTAVVIIYGEGFVSVNGEDIMADESDETIQRLCSLADVVTMAPNPQCGTWVRTQDTYIQDHFNAEADRNR
jgi:hypothetical protein